MMTSLQFEQDHEWMCFRQNMWGFLPTSLCCIKWLLHRKKTIENMIFFHLSGIPQKLIWCQNWKKLREIHDVFSLHSLLLMGNGNLLGTKDVGRYEIVEGHISNPRSYLWWHPWVHLKKRRGRKNFLFVIQGTHNHNYIFHS